MLFISPYFQAGEGSRPPLERTLDVKMEKFLTLIFIYFFQERRVIRQSNDVVADNPVTVADTW